MSDAVLEFDHVSKKFRRGEIHDSLRDLIPALTGRFLRRSSTLEEQEFWALDDVSFAVARGEALGIIGHNGAGKSTILKLLCGIMRPNRGTIVARGTLSALIEVGAGFHPDLTGRENVFLNGTILGMTRRDIQDRFDQIVEFAGLSEFIDTPVKRYSSGMYARLGFAVAAHVDPDVLIVDEVLSVGDYMFQQKCIDRMTEVIRGGTTVVFVSHNLRAVSDLCDRSLLLERGRVSALGSTDEVVRQYLQVSSSGPGLEGSKQVRIASLRLRGEQGETLRYETGQRVWVDVEVESLEPVEGLAIVLDMLDDSGYWLFNTSTQQLGEGRIALSAGERFGCTFELDLNLANGTYSLGATAHRFDTEEELDTVWPGITFYVSSSIAVRGAVNCNPRVTMTPRDAPDAPS